MSSSDGLSATNKDNSKVKKVAVNTGFLYFRMLITVFISLYITRLLLGSLGVKDFGIYNLVAGMISMLVFLNAAMTSATQRFMSYAQGENETNKQKKIFNVSIILHLIIGFVLVLFIEIIGYFLIDSTLDIPVNRIDAAKYVFHFMVISTFFVVISVPYDAVINARENMFFVAVVGVVEAFLKLAVAVFVTYTENDKLITFGLLMALVSILILITKRIYCHKNYTEVEINIKKHFDYNLFKEMGRFASWSFLGTSSSMVSFYGQGVLLNIFFGPIVNAAQAIAAQVNGQLSAFSTTMMQALNPMIVKSEGSGDRKLMLKASLFGAKVSFFLTMMFCVPVMVEMPVLFTLWLGEVPQHTIVFCQLLLVKTMVYQLVLPLNTSIGAVGNIKGYELIKSSVAVMPLIISYFLFSLGYPAFYIYIVFIGEACVSSIITLYFCKKHCGLNIKEYLSNVFLRCLCSIVIVVVLVSSVNFLLDDELIRVLVKTTLFVFIFVLSLLLVGFNKEERSILTITMKSLYTKILK